MSRIQLLPPELANQIAAGEVIERPASVVKELIENAIDAGATRIDIALADAGKTLIRVADNGVGLERSDFALVFEPHATSKLTRVEDLFNISTNGFRGEALASIQAVSRARLLSRTADAAVALEMEAEGGRIGEIREAAASCGTVVEVRDLFFNVPARRRWLKGESTEFRHIVELVQAIASANPEIGFSLKHGERTAIDLPPGQHPSERVRALYGEKFKEGMLEVHEHESYARLDGYLSPPGVHRPNSRGMVLFVNRRPIRDRSLIQAAVLAYREFLPPGRYPMVVLFLTVDPHSIDINVHPAKTEVRFLEQSRIFSLIKSACTEKLIHAGMLPAMKLSAPAPQARPDSPYEPTHDLASHHALFDPVQEQRARDAEHRWDRAREAVEEAVGPALSRFEVRAPQSQAPAEAEKSLLDRARGLFQVGNTYIVVEVDDGMVVIDQHAYHERILYWLLESRIQSQPVEIQRLLTPVPLELSLGARELAAAHLPVLKTFGFVIEPVSHEGLALTGVPKYSVSRSHQEIVQSICEQLAEGRMPESPDALRKSLVETVACHAAIKAGDALKPEQIRSLLEMGETVPHTFSCPHGRPTTYRLSFADLEKVFHRR